jgi:hypothetical protein
MNNVSAIYLARKAFWQSIRVGMILALLLTALCFSVVFFVASPKPEQIIRTADGTAWTVSDISAYIRGRLDDERGRTYCELMAAEPTALSTRDEDVLDRLTRDTCIRRLKQTW